MAKKKPRTPPPPRRVQAPKTRTGSSGKGKAAAGVELGELGARQRAILYGVAASGIIALIAVVLLVVLGGGNSGAKSRCEDARRCELHVQALSGAAANAALHDAQSEPEAELELVSADERPALLPVGPLGRLHRAGAADQGSPQPRARRDDHPVRQQGLEGRHREASTPSGGRIRPRCSSRRCRTSATRSR